MSIYTPSEYLDTSQFQSKLVAKSRIADVDQDIVVGDIIVKLEKQDTSADG